ncbi:MAG: hypothetical protein V1702_05545 [Candidatus Woesearchaeota archaeon]
MENAKMLWSSLPATERENYLAFHGAAYNEDLRHAEKNVFEFPRWSIISGYYCMHDLTKLFLAAKFNAKITSPEIHAKSIEALEYFIKDKMLREKILELLKEAKEFYYSAERLKERILPTLLRKGKEERGKAQYYSEDYSQKAKTNAQKAAYFLETIVKPYVKLVRGLME